MNTNLYNALMQARNFLITDENNRKNTEHSRQLSIVYNTTYNKYEHRYKKVDWRLILGVPLACLAGSVFIIAMIVEEFELEISKFGWLVDVVPIVAFVAAVCCELLFLLYVFIYNIVIDVKYSNYKKSKEFLQQREKASHNSIKEYENYKKLKQQQENYYKHNYQACLGFLPKQYHNKKAIESLLHYVKVGLANTLDEALACYGTELRETAEWKEHLEEKEIQRQRHKENQERLAEISKNQKDLEYKLGQMAKEAEYQRHMRRR